MTRRAEKSKMSKTKKIAIVSTVVVAGTSVAAFAYWSAGGSGTGTAATGDTVELTAVQTTEVAAMYPGDSAQTLSGTFDNDNSGPIYVTSVTASIASVFQGGSVAVGCDATDYTLASPVMTVGAEVPAGNLEGDWSGATIKFNNKASAQDACKGATVNLAYTIN